MSKQEFIDKLRISLNGHLSSGQVTEHIRYYEEYIRSELQKGRSEAEIMQMLGDPRLIAKTIVDTTEYAEEEAYGSTANESYGYRQYSGGYSQDAGYSDSYAQHGGTANAYGAAGYGGQKATGKVTLPGWVKVIIGIVIFCCIIRLIMSVMSFLMPILLPIFIVVFVTKLFRDWLK